MSSLRFLPGIIVCQAATAALVLAAMDSSFEEHLEAFLAIAVILALILALWFGSMGEHIRKDALLKAKDEFAREREQIIVSAEMDKRSVLEESHERIISETNRAHARANLKLGAALTGLVGIGGLLLAVEFISVGLMILAAAGGMLAGYVLRARQDALRRRETAIPPLGPSSIGILPEEGKKSLPPATDR